MNLCNKIIAEYAKSKYDDLDLSIHRLIKLANADLYNGPIETGYVDDEDIESWPGFVKACQRISEAICDLNLKDIYVDVVSESYSEEEPEYTDLTAIDIWRIERSELIKNIVGIELAKYL